MSRKNIVFLCGILSVAASLFLLIGFADSTQHKGHGNAHETHTPATIQKAVNEA